MRRERISPVNQRIYERYIARLSENAKMMIGKPGERGYPHAAGEDASKAAHWYFVLHPEDRLDPDAACSHAGRSLL